MKYLKKIALVLFAAAACGSCSFLDKESDTELTLPMVFNDKTRAEQWLAGCYSMIPDPIWGWTRHLGWEILGDDITPSERWRQYDWNVIPMILGNWNTSTGWNGNYWADLPKKIRACYIFMENVKPLPEQKLSLQEVEYMKAECRFLAAYYYSLLIDVYGPIPFKPGHITPVDATLAEMMEGQTPYDDIVDWIEKELLAVSKLLPATYPEGSKYGRATSVMCLAVRARMLLFAASPLVNGNPDYAGHKNNKGEELFNSTPDPDKWERAKDASKLLIDEAEAVGHALYYEYNDDRSIDPFMSYQNMMLVEYAKGNKEILFARVGTEYKEFDSHSAPRGSNGAGGLGVTQSLVDAFYDRDGKPFDENSAYPKQGFSNADIYWADKTAWDEAGDTGRMTLAGTYNMYCNREPRFYVSVLFNEAWYKMDERRLSFYYRTKDNDGTHDSPQNGYLVRKRTDPNRDPLKGYYTWRPGILYRLGEAYLNYAEALNEWTNGSDADILKYVNKIRKRAGIPELTGSYTYDQLKEIIRRERRVELNCEGLRYNDIRRWKLGEELLDGDMYGMNFHGTERDDNPSNPKAYFVQKKYQERVYHKKYYWFPIHISEMEKNPELVQNPFWNN